MHSFTEQRVLLDDKVILATENYNFINEKLKKIINNNETINFSENFITSSSFLGKRYDFDKLKQFLLLKRKSYYATTFFRKSLTELINLINIDISSELPFSLNSVITILNNKLQVAPTEHDLEILEILNEFSRNVDFVEYYNMITNKSSPVHLMATLDTDIQILNHLKDKFFEILKSNSSKSLIIKYAYKNLRERFIWITTRIKEYAGRHHISDYLEYFEYNDFDEFRYNYRYSKGAPRTSKSIRFH